jgi:hypothetical protein
MTQYITRGLTGLRLSHPVDFANCFIFAVFSLGRPYEATFQSVPTFYVFCPSQDPPLDPGVVLSALRNPNSVPVGTLTRSTHLDGTGDIGTNSFDSNVDINSFGGNYALRQTGPQENSVGVGFHSFGRELPARRHPLSRSVANLLNMLLQWWLSLLPDSSYGDMRVNVDPGDINGATSLTGRVIRFDSPQAWMIQMAQSGT